MHANSLAGSLLSFLLVGARVAAVFAFVPFAGWKAAAEPARIVLVVGLTVCLWPVSPVLAGPVSGLGQLAGWVAREATIGLGIGLATAFVLESFALGAQLIGAQAGYSYASTVDPTSQADSGILQVLSQLMASLLFLSLGLDRYLIGALARSYRQDFEQLTLRPESLIGAGADMWQVAFRLALPVVAFLVLLDVALALVGRVNAHLQLLSVAFPAKMLAALAVMAAAAPAYPSLFRWQAERFAALLAR
ncbi:MAG: flagellar biosynthetic protein FliR [Bryobacteraceae bacterium]|nr:flagellar biosynthetic protein FliR [Bryobacteraceae bacterium]